MLGSEKFGKLVAEFKESTGAKAARPKSAVGNKTGGKGAATSPDRPLAGATAPHGGKTNKEEG